MHSLKVGHYTSPEHGTGLSVFLFNQPGIGAYHICGASPASRELHILDLDSNVGEMHALMFTGGSAFGLGAADGVMQFLDEKGIGRRMQHGVVPIVPSAAIYDLAYKVPVFPNAEQAYLTCQAADEKNVSQGRIGAGTGATVGKLVPGASRMGGGFGFINIKLANGLIVSAYVVVNAVGDVRDGGGRIVAGARLASGDFANCQQYLLSGATEPSIAHSNTTLVAVFTNAKFSKVELKRIAKMATAGIAQAITPAFTRYDGDMIFCISLGDFQASELTVGALAADAIRQAIRSAVVGSKVV